MRKSRKYTLFLLFFFFQWCFFFKIISSKNRDNKDDATNSHIKYTHSIYSQTSTHTSKHTYISMKRRIFFSVYQMILFGVMLKIKVERQREFSKSNIFIAQKRSPFLFLFCDACCAKTIVTLCENQNEEYNFSLIRQLVFFQLRVLGEQYNISI